MSEGRSRRVILETVQRFAANLRSHFDRRHLADRVGLDQYDPPPLSGLQAMITPQECAALSCFAERSWLNGAAQDGLIIDAGCFIGASTLALAQGLERSPLTERDREGRILSYDLFFASPAIIEKPYRTRAFRLAVASSRYSAKIFGNMPATLMLGQETFGKRHNYHARLLSSSSTSCGRPKPQCISQKRSIRCSTPGARS